MFMASGAGSLVGAVGPDRFRRMRYIVTMGVLIIVLGGAASLWPNSGIFSATGANSWRLTSFGWPMEVWSREEHIYETVTSAPGERQQKVEAVRYPPRYKIRWAHAAVVFAATVAASSVLAFLLLPSRDK